MSAEPSESGERIAARWGRPAESFGSIEIAVVVLGDARSRLLGTAEAAGRAMRAWLAEELPAFDWSVTVRSVTKPDLPSPSEPVDLIRDTDVEAAAEGSDFTLVVTDRDLVARYQAYALGAPSRATATAVASTCRLLADGAEGRLAARLATLLLYLFARLNGLETGRADDDAAGRIESVVDLDRGLHLGEAGRRFLKDALRRISDPRVEEQSGGETWALRFYARALWETRREFLRALLRARPWLFPLHLSRLTTAALSTLLILLMTAEAWDLALRQSPWLVGGLSLAALVGTSTFVLHRQQLMIRRPAGRLTERRVLANVSTVAVVCLGFVATYLLLFAVTGGFAVVFFDRALIGGWAASTGGAIVPRHYLVMSGFVASLGIVIGALGASFEARSRFRHVAFIDEEI